MTAKRNIADSPQYFQRSCLASPRNMPGQAAMNILSLDKQIEIIGALCEGVGQRAVSRLTGADRKTVARLALSVGRAPRCALCIHDHSMFEHGFVQRVELVTSAAAPPPPSVPSEP